MSHNTKDLFLYIDNREVGSVKYFIESKRYTNIILQNLDVGDFMFVLKSKDFNNADEIECCYIIERKTMKDLIASVKDGRYKDQKNRLLENFPKRSIMYVIEDFAGFTKCMSNQEFDPDSKIVLGAIMNTMLRDDIKIVFTENINDTNSFLEDLFKRLVQNPSLYLKSNQDSRGGESCSSNDERNYGILNSSSSSMKKSANFSRNDFFVCTLMQIPGISSKTAKVIVSKYQDLITMLNDLNSLSYEERINVLKSIKTDKKSIGMKVAENINKYLLS